ncbi:MAG TPA: nucleoside deaminase [Solirubrobacterales bacterium]|nr:nucleoside deaminase [Solirubrobacterales bacterium]
MSTIEAAEIHVEGCDSWAWSEETHLRNMALALEAGVVAERAGRPAIGAVLVDMHGRVVSTGYDLSGPCCDPTAHAEMTAIREAAVIKGRTRLPDLVLYSTLEPCPMCVAAACWASLDGIVFGADGGVVPSGYYSGPHGAIEYARSLRRPLDGRPPFILGGVMVGEAAALLGA